MITYFYTIITSLIIAHFNLIFTSFFLIITYQNLEIPLLQYYYIIVTYYNGNNSCIIIYYYFYYYVLLHLLLRHYYV